MVETLGVDGLDHRVVARLTDSSPQQFRRLIDRPLGREAPVTHGTKGVTIRTRHSRIARATVAVALRLGISFDEILRDTIRAALELGCWDGNVSQHGNTIQTCTRVLHSGLAELLGEDEVEELALAGVEVACTVRPRVIHDFYRVEVLRDSNRTEDAMDYARQRVAENFRAANGRPADDIAERVRQFYLMWGQAAFRNGKRELALYVALRAVSEIKGLSREQVREQVAENNRRLYGQWAPS